MPAECARTLRWLDQAGLQRQPVLMYQREIGGRRGLIVSGDMELPGRLLAGPPARLLNAGGGPGTYAAPLASRGYRVHLVDPLRLQVEQARQAGRPRSRLRLHRPCIHPIGGM
jgi:hypothetical protein